MHVFAIHYAKFVINCVFISCMMQICSCDATAVGFDAYILLLHFICRDSSKYNQKRKKNWDFAVCLHTANEPNVLCRVLAHGKEDTRRQTVLLGWGSGYWMESLPCCDTGHTAYCKPSGTRQTGCSRHTAHASIVGRWHTANVGTWRR
jgi:hypothetical protein